VPQIEILITLDMQNGQIGVQGPIDNAVMAYGMLEAAKVAVGDYQREKAAGNRIVQPSAQDFSLPKLD
jgi:hypothetical protein